MKRIIFLSLIMIFALAGCSGSGGKSGAVGAVESYYQAIITQNTDQLTSVTCPEFLETAQVEFDSFMGVKTELQGFSCQESGSEGAARLVKCAGKIVATYGSDKMDFPIDDRIHKVQEQNGSFQVCGY